jgi:hypothetical protein
MEHVKKMICLFYEGRIGELFEREFKGELGFQNPGHKDSDVIVSFQSEAETPDAETINATVTSFLTGLGYTVKDMTSGVNNFHAQVLSPETDQVWVIVNISTQYPLPHARWVKRSSAHVRISCTISG